MNKIIFTILVLALFVTPITSVEAAGATFTDARITVGNGFSGGTNLFNTVNRDRGNAALNGGNQGAAVATAGNGDNRNGNLNLAAAAVGAGVGLNDIPETGIEVNAFSVSILLAVLILALFIARGVYTIAEEEKKNRERMYA